MKSQKTFLKFLNKHKKQIISLVFYALLGIGLCLLYVFREKKVLLMIDASITALIFIGILWFGYWTKRKSIGENKAIAEENKKKLFAYIEKKKDLTINTQSYNKFVLYNGDIILETTDWIQYKPKSGKKSGIPLMEWHIVKTYLDRVLSTRKNKV